MGQQIRGKYAPLFEALRGARPTTGRELRMTFAHLEGIIGTSLPASARRYREWWGNERERTDGRHVQARAWMASGWEVKTVDLANEEVAFVQRSASPSRHPVNISKTMTEEVEKRPLSWLDGFGLMLRALRSWCTSAFHRSQH